MHSHNLLMSWNTYQTEREQPLSLWIFLFLKVRHRPLLGNQHTPLWGFCNVVPKRHQRWQAVSWYSYAWELFGTMTAAFPLGMLIAAAGWWGGGHWMVHWLSLPTVNDPAKCTRRLQGQPLAHSHRSKSDCFRKEVCYCMLLKCNC